MSDTLNDVLSMDKIEEGKHIHYKERERTRETERERERERERGEKVEGEGERCTQSERGWKEGRNEGMIRQL